MGYRRCGVQQFRKPLTLRRKLCKISFVQIRKAISYVSTRSGGGMEVPKWNHSQRRVPTGHGFAGPLAGLLQTQGNYGG